MDIIKFNKFSKNYGKVKAVDELDFSIKKGNIVGFVGKNGAGKSTTLRCMLNMINPTSGSITINELDSVKDSKEIKKIVSYVPSDTCFYDNIKVIKLLSFTASFYNTKIEEINKLCKYFELDINKKINELSYGNKKKVALIIGLLKNSEILIFDEPTNGLDPLMQKKFFDIILKYKKKGKTIFLSSHNLVEIQNYCDEVAIIKDGKLVKYSSLNNIDINKQVLYYETKDGIKKSIVIDNNINSIIKELSLLDLVKLDIKTNSISDEFSKYYSGDK